MNGFALFYLGMFVERIAKTRSYYFSIFIVGGVLASMSSFFLAKQNSVGASGAIFALIGALFSIIWLSKDSISKEFRLKVLRDIVFIIAINIALGLSIDNVDNYAHMGGLVSGLVITYILYKFNNNILFKIFDLIAILLVTYGSIYFYNSLKNNYPESINLKKEIQISNISFKIPQSWKNLGSSNNSSFQDLFFTRFILEDINLNIYNKSEFLTKEVIKAELKNKKITSFDNTGFKINKVFIRLIKFEFEFDKKLNDIRVGRIYFFKYKGIYFRFMVIFFKESYNEYGDIMTRFLEFNLEK